MPSSNGRMDGDWAQGIARTELVALGGVYFYLVHDLANLDIDPVCACR